MPDLMTIAPTTQSSLRAEAAKGALYAVFDACDEPRVPIKVRELGDARGVSLYGGRADDDLWAIAPYLVSVDPTLLDWIVATLWTDPWGIFAVSGADLSELRTHFRKFLMVEALAGEQWYFRFYDPRVLAKFLPIWDARQLSDFFGPVTAYGWNDPVTYAASVATQTWFAASDPALQKPVIRIRRT